MALDHIRHWIFDLDNTLYRADAQFFSQIDRKMTEYIATYLKIDTVSARALQKQYLVDYGTSLSGLMAVHNMDPAEFLDFVHDVDVSMLSPNPLLREHIKKLPGHKYIFTNGSRGHAKNIASHLDLYDLFDGSFAIEDADYVPKPHPAPFEVFCARFHIDPKTAIMFEDGVRNLKVPKEMGMATVLIHSDQDWSAEPKAVRPAGKDSQAPWVDYITDDLAGWLGTYLHPRK